MQSNDKNFSQQSQKKQGMPEKRQGDIAGKQPSNRPEIDLPVQGGRSESDLSSTKQPQRDIEKNAPRDQKRETR